MRRKTHVILAAAAATTLVVAGCSSSSHGATPTTGSNATTTAPAATTTTTRAPAPAGPAATVSGPITGGNGVFVGSGATIGLTQAGYVQTEYFASGTARAYRSVGAHGKDGRWQIQPSTSAGYRTRIVVRRPADPQHFNGTLLVEWLNVSSGIDADPDFSYAGAEIVRGGYAWVGVSAQEIGVSGGTPVVPVPGIPTVGLRGTDPARYSSLHHPGDQYSLDMFSQVARALRAPGKVDALRGLRPRRVVAIGESQSAFELTTYIDAVQPVTHIFDGFFVHSRGGGAIPIDGGDISSGINGGIRIRDDVEVPVFLFETESDEAILRYFDARQPDSAHIRLWDVAGGSHADAFLVGGSTSPLNCKGPINTAPTHYVVEAALDHLDRWIRTGTPPPSAPRMRVVDVKGTPTVQRDARGNAIGGVRTAANDVPVATLSGIAADSSSVLCLLFGSTRPFDRTTLTQLYGTKAVYLATFRKATDKAIANGYLLAADRAPILAESGKVGF